MAGGIVARGRQPPCVEARRHSHGAPAGRRIQDLIGLTARSATVGGAAESGSHRGPAPRIHVGIAGPILSFSGGQRLGDRPTLRDQEPGPERLHIQQIPFGIAIQIDAVYDFSELLDKPDSHGQELLGVV